YACRSYSAQQGHSMSRRNITQNRNRAEQQPGEHRQYQREDERPTIQRNLTQARQVLRPNRCQQTQPRIRNSHADSSAQQTKRHTLQQQLTGNPPSARTSSRLATFVHAISMTMPIVAITTHSTLPMLPTTWSFKGFSAGVIFH